MTLTIIKPYMSDISTECIGAQIQRNSCDTDEFIQISCPWTGESVHLPKKTWFKTCHEINLVCLSGNIYL